MSDPTLTTPSPEAPPPGRYSPSVAARQGRTTGQSRASRRRMSAGRRAWYAVLVALVRGFLALLWKTCRVRAVLGGERIDALRETGNPAVIVYWHQMHVFGAWYLFGQVARGLRVGFLTSPSVSGEVPAAIIRRSGAEAVRGSSTRASGEALREMHAVVSRDRRSLVITADGPKGPLHEFKPGAALLSKVARVPVIPLAWAARRAIYWPSWDRFIIPLPFTEVVIAIGEPWEVPREISVGDLSPACRELERRLAALEREARAALR
ncbi:MAG: DUF374 domain-containing protein [Chromatiales bacterium]|nr:DUF374 domain-containing protein [Chromatiales bacterium]